ncbi:hypothetical protein PK35_02365 [Tamlana nanhaiensis]|uniref:Acyltransferase 3 domain-containing protein n=1 Tax=Neotamlana nanhaiensis TaxID=1382798 RepID=A0A0D7W7G6_9FLAO|nr:acyltransferase family protein [Tamlana nanhaiensis]KJD34638.1 hypothetical protein PK35_02365 [Tamlana nanhaiensis]
MRSKEQIKILDSAKGLSIVLMTLVHYPFIQKKNVYAMVSFLLDDVLMIFILPIFIFISGYFLNEGLTFKGYLFSKLDSLIKPILGFSICLTILKIILYMITSSELTLQGIMRYINAIPAAFVFGDLGYINYALWFVVALFWGGLSLKGVLELSKNKKLLNYFFLCLILLVLMFLTFTESKFYYFAYTPIFFTYLIIGYGFKKISTRYFNGVSVFYNKSWVIFFVLFIISWFVLRKFNLKTNLNLFGFNFNYHYFLLLSVLGIFAILFLCLYFEKIPVFNKILIECSKASFFILGYHVFVLDVFKYIFDLKEYSPIIHLFLFATNIFLCYCIYRITIKTPYLRILFVPLRGIKFNYGEIRLLSFKPIYSLIPNELFDIVKLERNNDR